MSDELSPAPSKDLAEYVDGVPARFVPSEMRGELVEAEHLARYWWAAGLAEGHRVLDAGCGVGYGSSILADRRAAEVVGVDVAAAVVEAASAAERPGLRFETGDLASLDHPDGSFDLIVCFEVIEHVDDPAAVLEELARLLSEHGVLVISSPNREAYVPGNPHHQKEFKPDEFEAALAELWSEVRLLRQHNWIGSAVLDDEATRSGTGEPVNGLQVRKLAAEEPGTEPYTVALAANSPLPDPPPVAALTGIADVRRWLEHYDAQQNVLEDQRRYLQSLQAVRQERNELRLRLVDAEARAASVMESEAELRQAHGDLQEEHDNLREAHRGTTTILNDVLGSPSWRVTKPLRAVKNGLLRRLPGRG